MTGRGKRGKPKAGFPLFPPPLEIATRFPHSHSLDDDLAFALHNFRERSPGHHLNPLGSSFNENMLTQCLAKNCKQNCLYAKGNRTRRRRLLRIIPSRQHPRLHLQQRACGLSYTNYAPYIKATGFLQTSEFESQEFRIYFSLIKPTT